MTGALKTTAQMRSFMGFSYAVRGSEFFHHTLAHGEFLHFSGHRHWELGNETNVTRDFITGNLAVAKGADVRLGHDFAGTDLDPGAQFLAEFSIGDAEHLRGFDF